VTATQLTPARASRISPGVAARVAWGVGIVAIVVTVSAMALVVATRSVPRPDWERPWQLVLLSIAWYLPFSAVGVIIAARRPANPLGWLLLAIGLTLALNDFMHYYGTYTLIYRPGALPLGLAVGWVSTWNWAIMFPVLPFVFLLFPDGRLPSPRWRVLAWASALCGGLILLLAPFRAGSLEYFPTIPNPVGIPLLTDSFFATPSLVYFTLLLVASSSLLVRFRRARGDQRQQLKWVAFAAVFFGVVGFVGPRWLAAPVQAILELLATLAFNAAIAIAILKYRLYEIDRLINRTLVYGLLTALLGGIYAGLVLVLGQLFGGIGAEPPSWAVAGATLAVAALFQPARRRIQQAVDRRFNRRKYNTAKTIEAFATRLRDQVDLDTLSTELLAVVDQTMEPTRVSLWLRPSTASSSGTPHSEARPTTWAY
jgi:hypothetical protein